MHPYANILVATRQRDVKTDLTCRFVDTAEALSQSIVIPSMPSQHLESYFDENAKFLKPGSLVVDVCSVKVKPVEILRRVLPQEVDILASHPLFGPASAKNTTAGHQIMLYPVRIENAKYETIKKFLSDTLQLRIIECTPEEHDRTLAYVQGLSHYIGRVMQAMDIPNTELMTNAYVDLLDMKRIQGGDSWELFESIMRDNPYAGNVHAEFQQACKALDVKLGLDRG